ncbi:MAG: Yip1 family protein [Methanosarcinales archaeon Met12]|nr:MAG: Yip1 family protein [Methanosarcinales archaeon Met12]
MTDLIEEIGGVIVSPWETLENISKKEDIRSAFIIVLIASILSGMHTILLPEMRAMFEILGVGIDYTILFVFSLVLGLIGWVLSAGIYRLIAMMLGGNGSYNKVLQLLGYAYAMYFVYLPVSAFVMIALPVLSGVITLIGLIWALILSVFAISIAEGFSKLRAIATVVIGIIAVVILFVIGAVIMMAAFMPVLM